MTANDTAAASYQLRRKDVELMRRALEALNTADFWLKVGRMTPEEWADDARRQAIREGMIHGNVQCSLAINALNERLLNT